MSNGEAMALTAARHTVQETRSERVAELFEAHHERLYRLARRMSGSAEEAPWRSWSWRVSNGRRKTESGFGLWALAGC
jgi:hypothetical protein